MMKRLVFALCVSFFFVSCAKEYSYEGGNQNTTDPEYYIKADIGGVPTMFKFSTLAKKTSLGNGENKLELMGFASSDNSDERGIVITIFYIDAASPTAPSFYLEYTQSGDYVIEAFYRPGNSTTPIYTAGYGYPNSTIPLIIAIDQLTTTKISGTFSGNFYLTDIDINGQVDEIHDEPVTIVNGKFSLPLQ